MNSVRMVVMALVAVLLALPAQANRDIKPTKEDRGGHADERYRPANPLLSEDVYDDTGLGSCVVEVDVGGDENIGVVVSDAPTVRDGLKQTYTSFVAGIDGAIEAKEAQAKAIEDEITSADHASARELSDRLANAKTPEERLAAADQVYVSFVKAYGEATRSQQAAAGSEFGVDPAVISAQSMRFYRYFRALNQLIALKRLRDATQKIADGCK